MKNHVLKKAGLTLGLLATALIASTSLAQGVGPVAKQPAGRKLQTPLQQHVLTAGTQVYTYTLLGYPGSLSTQGIGISPGAGGAGTAVVGAWNVGETQTGFLARSWGTHPVVESYQLVNDPSAPVPQQPYSINDFGTIVGDYIDASGIFHGYENVGGKFKPLEVTFTRAAGTYSPAINNAGEISGGWFDGAGNSHGFTLTGGIYASFDFPGAPYTDAFSINSEGDIAGYYEDTGGNFHGFLRRRGAYTSIDFPGAVFTLATGINDSGDVVGSFCLTSQCLATGEGEQGFLLRKGIYTPVAIAGESGTSILSINNNGVLLGGYSDAAGLFYTFLATP